MIVGGIPLYVCATASIPIAAALMLKGLSPGAAFVFLAVGPATNAATVTLIASVMGKKIVAIYLAVIAVLAVVAGLALNGVFALLGLDVNAARQGHAAHEVEVGPVTLMLAALFAVLLVLSLGRRILLRRRTKLGGWDEAAVGPDVTEIPIEGMICRRSASRRSAPG